MPHRLSDIARALDARLEGRGDLMIDRAAEPAEADARALALAMAPEYAEGLAKGKARAAVLWEGADWRALGLEAALFVPRPRYAMAGITRALDPGPEILPGIHPSAVIHPEAEISPDAAIGPLVVIGRGARIGQGARIGPHCHIAEEAELGPGALLVSGVRLGARVRIGARFIAHPGAVVGADGFSFVTPEKSAVEAARESLGETGGAAAQSWTRIHSLGGVEIGDDVEIGANSTIDRGTIRATRIGDGTKIDNLVDIGHNVTVGRDCLLCGQVGIAGSARIGDRVVLGGQCGVSDNIFVGDDVVAGGSTKIYSNAPAGRMLLGAPAQKMVAQIELYKLLRRLPRLFAQVAELRQGVKGTAKRGEADWGP
ncbi:UDP-3-O-(3-hydroxymyristoyl)glucosamine N-acyltransferase [Pararhodobacter sp. SW119]|uniref:UDP-3-O-(3-hydroxymyristoyl)glucosamine N-acyltransferase n=1 Tax=Pararhodobacter sp. SW119 TaxID=2780075 RepID=UPI001ADF6113|nr:UDP-3-O-(3-hydroxymyristoyl)glucosamine N-acyltransferase [Pararhodobacter sp. SW119]